MFDKVSKRFMTCVIAFLLAIILALGFSYLQLNKVNTVLLRDNTIYSTNYVRMERVARQLQSENKALKEIIDQLGFKGKRGDKW